MTPAPNSEIISKKRENIKIVQIECLANGLLLSAAEAWALLRQDKCPSYATVLATVASHCQGERSAFLCCTCQSSSETCPVDQSQDIFMGCMF